VTTYLKERKMNDRELLEQAAKAAGLEYTKPADGYDGALGLEVGPNPMRTQNWNPLTDDADALRLAVKLQLLVNVTEFSSRATNGGLLNGEELHNGDPYAATRRAIVRAAAEIGRGMP
jgi:hypothetical protein